MFNINYMKRLFYIFILVFALRPIAEAQVGINTSTPDSTAVLDLYSTKGGLLIPRMTSAQRNAMASNGNIPAHSLLVFDKDMNKVFYYDVNKQQWVMLNPFYSDVDNNISYGAENSNYKIHIKKSSSNKVFHVYSSFSGAVSDSLKFQSEFVFDDYLVPKSGIKFNAKVSGGDFILMKAYYKDKPVMTLRSNGNMGLGYTNPSKRLEVRGDMKSSGEVRAEKFNGKGTIPIGGIIMWKGSTTNLPAGWALCDGSNGTPDLRDRFIIGGGGSYPQNSTGGAATVTLTVAQMPAHSHTGTTDVDGEHIHMMFRGDEDNGGSNSVAYWSNHGYDDQYKLRGHSWEANRWNTSSNGEHTHTLNVYNTGGGHAHENLPPYYALAYIIRTN